MELYFNELSLHGQFETISGFVESFGELMRMRNAASRFQREVHVHRRLAMRHVTPTHLFPQALSQIPAAQRSAVTSWIARSGPFWEDAERHPGGEMLETNLPPDTVTDSSVGEAAWRCLDSVDARLLSVIPSQWALSPIRVTHTSDDLKVRNVDVVNYVSSEPLATDLERLPLPVATWPSLAAAAQARFANLTFAPNWFEPLLPTPYVNAACGKILGLLDVLDRYVASVGPDGSRSPEGQRLYEQHFVGDNAWFSDSSDSEKREFERQLTFRHPNNPGVALFCTWHGKVRTQVLRLHFSWPVEERKLYVVYVGPKITKR